MFKNRDDIEGPTGEIRQISEPKLFIQQQNQILLHQTQKTDS